MLGWAVGPLGRHLYIRQLQDQKAGAVVEAMTFDDLATWGELCGWGLARGHARTGRTGRRSPATSATTTRSTTRLADFAVAYADQTDRDHAAFVAAIRAGRIKAESGI